MGSGFVGPPPPGPLVPGSWIPGPGGWRGVWLLNFVIWGAFSGLGPRPAPRPRAPPRAGPPAKGQGFFGPRSPLLGQDPRVPGPFPGQGPSGPRSQGAPHAPGQGPPSRPPTQALPDRAPGQAAKGAPAKGLPYQALPGPIGAGHPRPRGPLPVKGQASTQPKNLSAKTSGQGPPKPREPRTGPQQFAPLACRAKGLTPCRRAPPNQGSAKGLGSPPRGAKSHQKLQKLQKAH